MALLLGAGVRRRQSRKLCSDDQQRPRTAVSGMRSRYRARRNRRRTWLYCRLGNRLHAHTGVHACRRLPAAGTTGYR
ncbi:MULTISPECIES: hypothetical protein [Haloarcula]|uniref:hypothetical protein n=1 Tax=Haloarcula TaxID=2237 RepID=UPI0039A76126